MLLRARRCLPLPEDFDLLPNPGWPKDSKFPRQAEEPGRQCDGEVPATRELSSGRINNILGPTPNAAICSTRTLMHVHDSRTPSSRCCGNLYMTTRCTFRTMGLRPPKDQHGRGAAAQAPMQAWHNCNSRERERVLPARKRRGPAPCSVAALGQLTCTRFSGFRSCARPSASSPRHYHPSPSRSARAQSAN